MKNDAFFLVFDRVLPTVRPKSERHGIDTKKKADLESPSAPPARMSGHIQALKGQDMGNSPSPASGVNDITRLVKAKVFS